MAAVGSVWNANSWHWEEKNYNGWACDQLRKLLTSFEWEGVTFVDPKIAGDASVSVRKGRRIVALDLEISSIWVSSDIRGKIVIPSFDVESCEDDDYDVQVTVEGEDDRHIEVKEKIRKGSVGKKLRELLKQFVKDLQDSESEKSKLELDRKRREIEKETMQAASTTTRSAQVKLLEETKVVQQQQRIDRIKSENTTRPLGEGSVWNVNSYHWEERPVTRWAVQKLEALFSSQTSASICFKIEDGDCDVEFFNPDITGEASTSIRKGKKVVIFELKIRADWKASLRDGKGNFLADATGSLEIPEFSSEDFEDKSYSVQISGDSEIPARRRINKAMMDKGVQEVRKLLAGFVEELKAH